VSAPWRWWPFCRVALGWHSRRLRLFSCIARSCRRRIHHLLAYALLAILIGAAAVISRRAERLARGAASAPTPAYSENIHSFFQGWQDPALQGPGSAARGDADRARADPLQLIAIALISGFIVGRN